MTARPDPVEAYRLCDLPVGTRYQFGQGGEIATAIGLSVCTVPVYVVEWPTRTYDGIPADDLDTVLAWAGGLNSGTMVGCCERIRAAIAAQEQAS